MEGPKKVIKLGLPTIRTETVCALSPSLGRGYFIHPTGREHFFSACYGVAFIVRAMWVVSLHRRGAWINAGMDDCTHERQPDNCMDMGIYIIGIVLVQM